MREIPFTHKPVLISFILIAAAAGLLFHIWDETKLDNWIHDSALIHQARTEWQHTAIVVLDHGVPIEVGRKQALPLFAKAAERVVAAGAKGVFLDSRLAKEIEGRMPYAICISETAEVQWSEPECVLSSTGQCLIKNSQLGHAPLQMNAATMQKFSLAPYLGDPNLPDFMLFSWDSAAAIPEEGLVVSDRLVTKNDPIARWLDLTDDHAIIRMGRNVNPTLVAQSLSNTRDNERCDSNRVCRRIRLSQPMYELSLQSQRYILPVSILASCNTQSAEELATLLKDKVVILQTTAPAEATDILVTPMTTALFGPKAMTPGAQYLADALETLLLQDHPRVPKLLWIVVLISCAAIISVISGAYCKQAVMWGLGVLLFMMVCALCLFNQEVQLWPVTATMLSYITGAVQITGIHLMIGFREGKLISHYMPKQIHNLLISLKESDSFHNKRCWAVVLMSDLAGYTTVTGLLKQPTLILKLMNQYLDETSYVLQEKYNGWLESYVGDMVCYYWPCQQEEHVVALKDALQGAIELASLQKRFFSELQSHFQDDIDAETLQQVSSIINAGIGLSTGEVVMGDLGPKRGVRKFGIIGDPLNTASRIESLTRLFNTEIIITSDFTAIAENLGYSIRRIGSIKLKGKVQPETLFAFGESGDPRFQKHIIDTWEQWLSEYERLGVSNIACPDALSLDRDTLMNWRQRNLLGPDKVWYLDEK